MEKLLPLGNISTNFSHILPIFYRRMVFGCSCEKKRFLPEQDWVDFWIKSFFYLHLPSFSSFIQYICWKSCFLKIIYLLISMILSFSATIIPFSSLQSIHILIVLLWTCAITQSLFVLFICVSFDWGMGLLFSNQLHAFVWVCSEKSKFLTFCLVIPFHSVFLKVLAECYPISYQQKTIF